MNTEQLFSLVFPLNKQERDTIRTFFKTLGKGHDSKTVMLYEALCKAKSWKESIEQKFKTQHRMSKQRYYEVRLQLTEWLIQGLGNMERNPVELRPFYRYAVNMALLNHLWIPFNKDIAKLLTQENFAEAASLMELAEDTIDRNYGDKERKKLADLPTAYTINGWIQEIAEMRHGIQRVRAAIKLPMAERLVLAEAIWAEVADRRMNTNKATVLQERLKARIYMLRGDQEKASSQGLMVLDILFQAMPSVENTSVILDEYLYLIPALLESDQVNAASRLVMKLEAISLFHPMHEERKHFLECKNMVAMTNHTQNLGWVEKAKKSILKKPGGISTENENKWWYCLALSYFMNGSYQKCNLILTRYFKQQTKNRRTIHWMAEFLQAMSLFMREETEISLKILKRLARKIPEEAGKLPAILCQMTTQIIKKAPSLRNQEIEVLKQQLASLINNPEDAQLLPYFDTFRFLESLNKGVTMKEIPSLPNEEKKNILGA